MNGMNRRCPVCWQVVQSGGTWSIEGHWDTAGRDVCPGTGEPYRITVRLTVAA